MSAAVVAAIAGGVTALLLPLIALVGTRANRLKMMTAEAELIALLPDGSQRREDLESAADISARKYLEHAQEPVKWRMRWAALVAALGLAATSGVVMFETRSTAMQVAAIVGWLFGSGCVMRQWWVLSKS